MSSSFTASTNFLFISTWLFGRVTVDTSLTTLMDGFESASQRMPIVKKNQLIPIRLAVCACALLDLALIGCSTRLESIDLSPPSGNLMSHIKNRTGRVVQQTTTYKRKPTQLSFGSVRPARLADLMTSQCGRLKRVNQNSCYLDRTHVHIEMSKHFNGILAQNQISQRTVAYIVHDYQEIERNRTV
jgi:hypothetical protein